MNNYEFVSYVPTPNEQYFQGIVTVRAYGKIILRYAVKDKKDGTGFFIVPATFRISDPHSGDYKYLEGAMLDSKMENDDLQALMRKHVNSFRNQGQQSAQTVNQQYQQPQAQPSQQTFQPDLNSCPF